MRSVIRNNSKGLTLRFGVDFDGAFLPREALSADATVGERRVGPLGLLEELERSLSLAPPRPSHSRRVSAYETALSAAADGRPFYAASFEKAPRRVATHLLDLRDELLLAGWEPDTAESQPPRLRDLAAVEKRAAHAAEQPRDGTGDRPGKSPAGDAVDGTPDRLRAVLAALDGPVPGIERIVAGEPLELLPPPWRRLLDALGRAGTPVEEPPWKNDSGRLDPALAPGERASERDPEAVPPTDAQAASRLLFEAAAGIESAPSAPPAPPAPSVPPAPVGGLHGDGTLRLVHGGTHAEHAQLAARILEAAGARKSGKTTTLIVPHGAGTVAEAATAHGLPRPQAQRAGGATQAGGILRLLPAFLFEPLDPQAVAEFLWIAPNPLGSRLSRRLLAQLQQRPGFDSPEWRETVGAATPEQRGRYQAYFGLPRAQPEEGAPAETAAAPFEELARWARGTAHARESRFEHRQDWQATADAAGDLAAHLSARGEERIGPTELAYLIEEYLPAPPAGAPEAGADALLSTAGALDRHPERLLWLPWVAEQGEHRHFLSAEERAWLKARGAEPADPALARRRTLYHAARAFAASAQVTLFLPETLDGEEPATHPAFALLDAAFDLTPVTIPAGSDEAFPHFETLPAARLPAPAAEWRLGSDLSPAADRSLSYSRLNDLLRYPYRWVLAEKAHLERSDLFGIPGGPLLYGTVVHEIARRWFARTDALSADTSLRERWFEEEFEGVLAGHAAALRSRGFEAERERLRRLCRDTLATLSRVLAESGWRLAGVEENIDARLAETPVHGRADILLVRGEERGVIDLKWSSRARFEQQLRDDEAYQLALYALMSGTEISSAHVGYFIVSEQRLLTTEDGAFAGAVPVASEAGRSLADVAELMSRLLTERRDELRAGRVPLPDRGEVPSSDDYIAFLGWEP